MTNVKVWGSPGFSVITRPSLPLGSTYGANWTVSYQHPNTCKFKLMLSRADLNICLSTLWRLECLFLDLKAASQEIHSFWGKWSAAFTCCVLVNCRRQQSCCIVTIEDLLLNLEQNMLIYMFLGIICLHHCGHISIHNTKIQHSINFFWLLCSLQARLATTKGIASTLSCTCWHILRGQWWRQKPLRLLNLRSCLLDRTPPWPWWATAATTSRTLWFWTRPLWTEVRRRVGDELRNAVTWLLRVSTIYPFRQQRLCQANFLRSPCRIRSMPRLQKHKVHAAAVHQSDLWQGDGAHAGCCHAQAHLASQHPWRWWDLLPWWVVARTFARVCVFNSSVTHRGCRCSRTEYFKQTRCFGIPVWFVVDVTTTLKRISASNNRVLDAHVNGQRKPLLK